MLIPEIISESSLQPFKVYQDGQVLQAILHRFIVYRLARCFRSSRRSEAFDLAWQFAEQGYPTLISTKSEANHAIYSVWVDIRHAHAHRPAESRLATGRVLVN